VSSGKTPKGHLKHTKEVLVKVLTESAVILLILGCGWMVHTFAKWLFTEATPCHDRTEITITIHGDSGAPRPGSIDMKAIEERCKESK
jgi:hypothetical protein